MAEKEQFKLLHNLNITIETAAYLDVGREWEKMVESFAYYRLYYVRSGSGKLVLTNKTIELEEGYMYFIPAFSILGSIVFACLYKAGSYISGITLAQMELFKMLPYIVTIIVLIVTSIFDSKNAQPPQALGQNYFREDR